MFDPNLMIAPDAGGQFAQGFEHGQQTGRQNKARAAMAALVRDPGNQGAFEALASVDPEAAQQFQAQRLESAKAQLGAHYDSVLKGAQLIRQMQPKDDASWQQVRGMAAQAGIDVSQVPEHFDQQYVSGLVSLADAFSPQKGAENPSSVREFEYAKQNGFAGGYTDFLQYVHPPSAVTVPAGATVTAPGQGGMPHVTDQASYDAIPPGGQYTTPDGHVRTKQGGPTHGGSGGFPY